MGYIRRNEITIIQDKTVEFTRKPAKHVDFADIANRLQYPQMLPMSAATATIGALHLLDTATIPLVLLFPFLLRAGRTALQCATLAFTFFAGASYSLLAGIAVLDNPLTALGAWLLPPLALSVPFLCVRKLPYCGVLLAFSLTVIPPFGLLLQASPLISAGFLLPGAGAVGLFATIIASQMIYSLPLRFAAPSALAALLVMFHHAIHADPPENNQNLVAVNTTGGQAVSAGDCCEADHASQTILWNALQNQPVHTISVFPEAIAGRLSLVSQDRLQRFAAATEQPFFAGGEVETTTENKTAYDNVLFRINPHTIEVAYRQRLPAPWFMWRPGADGYFTAELGRPAQFNWRGSAIGALICYEISAPYTALTTFASANTVIAISNIWWGRKTRLPKILRIQADGWARLYNTPLVMAQNI